MDKQAAIAAVILAIALVALVRAANSKEYGPDKYPDFWRAFGVVNYDCGKAK